MNAPRPRRVVSHRAFAVMTAANLAVLGGLYLHGAPTSAAGCCIDVPPPTRTPDPSPPPAPPPPRPPAARLEPLTLLFEFDKAELTPDAAFRLDSLIATLKARSLGGTRITIVGHACRIGRDGHNDRLSKRRASAVSSRMAASLSGYADVTYWRGSREPTPETRTACAGFAPGSRAERSCLGPDRRVVLTISE